MDDATNVPKAQITVYKAKEAPNLTPETMPLGTMRPADEKGYPEAMASGLGESALVRLLFEDEKSGVSLTYAWFKSHAALPRHSHSADCLYYVVSGSLQFGNEDLGPGDGFLVPKDTLYSYIAGPSGVEVLEFRTATKFDISFNGTDASWDRLISNVRQHRGAWAAMKPPPAAEQMLSREG